ncbi:MAG: hypothetical protein ACLFPJ_02690 [Candidatus Woesearchaeota archaeon]
MKNFKFCNKLLLILVLGLSVFIFGCDQEDKTGSPWLGGYEGLVVEFEKIDQTTDFTGSFSQVWEDETFPVFIYVNNRGEYEVPANDVFFEIKGIASSDFSGLSFTKRNSETIERVSEFMPNGGETYVDFGSAKYNRLVGTHYDAEIFIYYTYPYKTTVNVQDVCYKYDPKDTTICKVDSVRSAHASGGPIQIGTVTQRYIGKGSIIVEIPIKNVGKGKVKPAESHEFNSVHDEIYFETNDRDWECRSRGNPSIARITHQDGVRSNTETVILCTNRNVEAGANYQKAVTLELTYYYQDWISHKIRIKENP